ncbi:MAG: hypothetical protein M3015_16730, partial [Bacteroidota bacterium]|nr:hypothetical protein [Bacteroidota bacterium]
WPSITISLLLVISIVFVGYINTHNDKALIESRSQTPARNANTDKGQAGTANEKLIALAKTTGAKNNGGINSGSKSTASASTSSGHSERRNNTLPGKQNMSNEISHQNDAGVNSTSVLLSENIRHSPSPGSIKVADSYSENQKTNFSAVNTDDVITKTEHLKQVGNNSGIISNDISFEKSRIEMSKIPLINSLTLLPINALIVDITSPDNLLPAHESAGENSLVANISLPSEQKLNTKTQRKRNDKTTWLFYATPLLGSASFNGKHLTENTNQNTLSSPQVTQKDIRIMHNPAIGVEAGIQMNYLFAKRLQFTVGAQFTRSGYNITSNEVHPTLTTLLLKDKATGDQYSRNFVTHYGDGNGQSTITLHNYSYQASVPIGVQYQLLGNNKIQFNLGINLEPSLALKSNAYLLSSDGRNYVNVPDLYRRWNLNSSFSPFITFKSDKFKWNLGPVIRYQWLSSYIDDYTIKEHLINYGIRLGISKGCSLLQ